MSLSSLVGAGVLALGGAGQDAPQEQVQYERARNQRYELGELEPIILEWSKEDEGFITEGSLPLSEYFVQIEGYQFPPINHPGQIYATRKDLIQWKGDDRKKELELMGEFNPLGLKLYIADRTREVGLEAATGVRTRSFSERTFGRERELTKDGLYAHAVENFDEFVDKINYEADLIMLGMGLAFGTIALSWGLKKAFDYSVARREQ